MKLLKKTLLISASVIGSANAAVLSLDGVDDHMTFVGTGIPTGNSVFSVEVWINTDTNDKAGPKEGQMVYFWGNQSGNHGHGLVLKDATHSAASVADRVSAFVWAGAKVFAAETTTNLANPIGGPNRDGWRHLTVTYDGAIRKIYVDGVLSNTGTKDVFKLAAANFMIGKRPAGEGFDGLIDEVRFWDKALTGVEIASQWNKKLAGTESNLVAYFDFENGTTDVAGGNGTTDVAGGNNTGTLRLGASINSNFNAPLVLAAPEPATDDSRD